MKLKMRATDKSFGKICVKKLLEIPFFQIFGLQKRRRKMVGTGQDMKDSLDACS